MSRQRLRDFISLVMIAGLFLLVISGLWLVPPTHSVGASQAGPAPRGDYSAPRKPKLPVVNSVEELLPNVRYLVETKRPYTEYIHMYPLYGLKGGEKILFVVDNQTDPWVTEAFSRVLRDEKKCLVDVVVLQQRTELWDAADAIAVAVKQGGVGGGRSVAWLNQVAKNYDMVIGTFITGPEDPSGLLTNGQRMIWHTREVLADPDVRYPVELLDAIDRKAWQTIRIGWDVRITDPEGTDLGFTLFDEWWQITEGTHPTIKNPGEFGYMFYRGASETPQIPGHLSVHPRGGMIDKANATGVVAGTSMHEGPVPFLKITLKNNRMLKIEGGGRVGELWRGALEESRDIKFPFFPEPGVAWFVEATVGTHPKMFRPPHALTSIRERHDWSRHRMTAGVMHLGHGVSPAREWGRERGFPDHHYHLEIFFPTCTITTRDGKTNTLVRNGHLTALDDPELRQLASKYGDPNKLLERNWIPAIPGINAPGSWEAYAKDPVSWLKKYELEE